MSRPLDMQGTQSPQSNQQNFSSIGLLLRGMAMGAADVVPGVSGGTIAFITGIYEKLIDSISSVNLVALRQVFAGNILGAWRYVNGAFLVTVFAGILFSIFSLANLISWALETYPHFIWSYFFGLICASVVLLAKHSGLSNWQSWLALGIGTVIAYGITQIAQLNLPGTSLMVFVAGTIAICAMILPGISGSFILLILGMYQHIIAAVKELNVQILLLFAMGCVTGLLIFSRLLSWLLHRYHEITLALLTGFMLGSLGKVWPWKQQLVEGSGVQEINVSPSQYELITQQNPQILWVIVSLVLGCVTVFLIERLGNAQSGAK